MEDIEGTQESNNNETEVSHFTRCPTFSVFSCYELIPAVSGPDGLADLMVCNNTVHVHCHIVTGTQIVLSTLCCIKLIYKVKCFHIMQQMQVCQGILV